MIEAYIFDQDGTLYPKENKLFHILRVKTKQWLMKSLKINRDEVEELYKFLPKNYPHPFEGFASLGLTVEEYHKEVFDNISPEEYTKKDEKLVELFKSIKVPKYVVTLASKNYSFKLQKALGIEKLIDNSVFVIDFFPKCSKIFPYKYINKKLNIDPKKICVVGDNLEVDIIPALEGSFQTILIGKNVKAYEGTCVSSIYNII